MERLRPEPREAARCPLCREALEEQALELRACAGCETRYHALCLEELGGCAVLGCAGDGGQPAGQAASSLPPRRLAELRRQVAEANQRWSRLLQLPTRVTSVSIPDGAELHIAPPRGGLVWPLVALAPPVFGLGLWAHLGSGAEDAMYALLLVLIFVPLVYGLLAYAVDRVVIRVTPGSVSGHMTPVPFPWRSAVPRRQIVDVTLQTQLHHDEHGHASSLQHLVVVRGRGDPVKILPWAEDAAVQVFVRDWLRRELELTGPSKDAPPGKG